MKTVRPEKTAKKSNYPHFIIGIDEAGRGPLAGPVVVAGILLTVNHKRDERKILAGIRDSKKLTGKQREKWFKFINNHPRIRYARSVVSPEVIDKINISQAANAGANGVCRKLISRAKSKSQNILVRLDGGLRLPKHITHKVMIKGDEKIPTIAAASIVAKVTRDKIMSAFHEKYPAYGFNQHKGYGTKLHRQNIARFGLSAIHRKSFRMPLISQTEKNPPE